MSFLKTCLSFFILGLFFPVLALAEKPAAKGFLGLSIGFYNVLDGDQQSQDIRLEYRHNKPLLKRFAVKPWAGLMGTTDGSFWAGGGLYYDLALNKVITLSPSIGVGGFRDGSNDVDLGYAIEFRTQLELSYQLQNDDKLALAFSHFSNAGLGDSNPGVESLALYYLKSL